MTAEDSAEQAATALSEYRFTQVQFRCITPLHVGCGQDVGVVDLPVIRERTTGYPVVPGSGIRGSFRERCGRQDSALTPRLFGADDATVAGCVIVGDARLLLFPVRSHPGVFRWITCPFVLARYAADVDYFEDKQLAATAVAPPNENAYLGAAPLHNPLLLEEFPFEPGGTWTCSFAVDGVDPARVVLVHDEVFAYFARHATIVTQHNHLSAAKTVLAGQLFSVEAVPAEAVFYGFVGTTAERRERNAMDMTAASSELRRLMTGAVDGSRSAVVMGGDEGTGLGLTRVTWY